MSQLKVRCNKKKKAKMASTAEVKVCDAASFLPLNVLFDSGLRDGVGSAHLVFVCLALHLGKGEGGSRPRICTR